MPKAHAHRQLLPAVKAPALAKAHLQAAAVSRTPRQATRVHHAQAQNMCAHKANQATTDLRQRVAQDKVQPTRAAAIQVRAAAAQATTEAVLLHREAHHRV